MNTMNYVSALFGGVLIGLAAILLLLTNGKIAGISGMLGGLFRSRPRPNDWRIYFLGGLLAGGLISRLIGIPIFIPLAGRSAAAIILAGLLVGIGTQLGSGCTSGHGVCGIGRGSVRSLAATLTFMLTGAATVTIIKHFLGDVL